MNPALHSNLFQEDLYQFKTALLVVLPRPWHEYDSTATALLEKILTSVRIDLSGVQILCQGATTLKDLAIYNPARVLLFGTEVSPAVAPYETAAAHGFTVIRADDLTDLDDARKKRLWLALRQMFGL